MKETAMKPPLTVTDCRTYLLDIPLQRPHVMSFGSVHAVNYVLVRLETAEGFVGWGEAATFHGPTWSEESAEGIRATIETYFFPRLQNSGLLDYRVALDHTFAPYQGNHFARAAVEFAVLDIVGQHYGQPVCMLLGGKFRDSVDLSWSLASGTLEGDVAEARQKYGEGYRIFKFKFGADSWPDDLIRLEAVRAELGDGVRLRVDVNQGWNLPTARKALQALNDAGIDFLEQPLPKWDLDGLAEVRAKSAFPVMADESLCSGQAALGMIRGRSVDIFAYKLTKLGGLLNALDTYHMAQTAGIGAYIGCMIETSIGTAAYLQFAAALPELAWGCELWGPEILKGDVADHPIRPVNGKVYLPEGTGLGVRVNIDKVRQYQKGE